ncbi:hypothetical protein QCA50_006902 [Cerrena zonata]|uniref:Glycosyl hydrolase family 92 N-terminal domain-containing protein n=1 Tax=Cerrena zonata TaxID=2478898 RepID=A0AAW0GCU5_9APHY
MVSRILPWVYASLWMLYITPPILGAAVGSADTTVRDPASLVNLFIGTTKGGHTFPGVTLPHGMVKVGPDTNSPDNHAGYDGNPDFNFVGFSQMHDDGGQS